jgi:uroporphyrinogen decarboxylase
MMRQAGRYLPEYQEIRSKQKDFIEFCYDKEAASTVTMQPLARFDLDAAIIFSDILTIPQALGYKVDFSKGEGPKLTKPTTPIVKKELNLAEKLKKVYETISIVKNSIDKSKALIGFSGAPWTLMCYMFTDGSKQYANVKQLAYSGDRDFYEILELVKECVVIHLKEQIKAGADLVQIFDSWSGLLDNYHFETLVINSLKEIILEVKKEFPNVPIIVFAKDAGIKTLRLVEKVKLDGVSLSYTEDINFFAKELHRLWLFRYRLFFLFDLPQPPQRNLEGLSQMLVDFEPPDRPE